MFTKNTENDLTQKKAASEKKRDRASNELASKAGSSINSLHSFEKGTRQKGDVNVVWFAISSVRH